MPEQQQYWLVKSEPESRLVDDKDVRFSIDDLARVKVQAWDGVRNGEASKIMREKMRQGDKVFFYHSNCKVPGIVGVATVHREGYPDYTAWDAKHPYFDAKTDKAKPRWYMVDLEYDRTFARFIPLRSVQTVARDPTHVLHNALKDMTLVRRGRLSVQPVSADEYDTICRLGDGPLPLEPDPVLQPLSQAKRKPEAEVTSSLSSPSKRASPSIAPRRSSRKAVTSTKGAVRRVN